MIVALLQLRCKQFCTDYAQFTDDSNTKDALAIKNIEHFITYWEENPSFWINAITEKFYKYWKIGKHWIIKMRNSIAKQLDYKIILLLAET